jgi:hypothetical protein
VIGVGCCALALGWVVGCGGAVTHGGPMDDDPVPGAGTPSTPSGRAGHASGGSSNAGQPGVSGSAGKPIKDPPPVTTACPMEDLPPPSFECDPSVPDECGPGAGCYPFVDHPEGKGCDAQFYGTVCQAAGVGTQGMLCGDDNGDWCAPGFVCVVGQRAGTRCAQLCDLTVDNPCPGGLICGDLDVAGFGVCG